MVWLRWLVVRPSPWRPGFASGLVHVVFVVDKVALGQVLLPCHHSIMALIFVCHLGDGSVGCLSSQTVLTPNVYMLTTAMNCKKQVRTYEIYFNKNCYFDLNLGYKSL
jgi:hypothetical protein